MPDSVPRQPDLKIIGGLFGLAEDTQQPGRASLEKLPPDSLHRADAVTAGPMPLNAYR